MCLQPMRRGMVKKTAGKETGTNRVEGRVSEHGSQLRRAAFAGMDDHRTPGPGTGVMPSRHGEMKKDGALRVILIVDMKKS